MKRIFMRGNPGDFANYVAALTACGAEPVISMTLSDADTCDGLLIPGGAVDTVVEAQVCAAETLLVGQVPDTYLELPGGL